MSTAYVVPDGPKELRETLCVAQVQIGKSFTGASRKREHIDRLQRLIDECDLHRPIGADAKHGDRDTPTCGCEDLPQHSLLRKIAALADEMENPNSERGTMPGVRMQVRREWAARLRAIASSPEAPRDDIVAHTVTDDCICGPTNKFVESRDGSGGFICTHHSLDRREAHE